MDSGPDGTRGGMAGLEQANAARKAALFAKLFAQLGPGERTVLEVCSGGGCWAHSVSLVRGLCPWRFRGSSVVPLVS